VQIGKVTDISEKHDAVQIGKVTDISEKHDAVQIGKQLKAFRRNMTQCRLANSYRHSGET